MKFEELFPARVYLNLGRRPDRRGEVEWKFLNAGIEVERFAAVDARYVNRMALENKKRDERIQTNARHPDDVSSWVRGYENAGRYALALTQRLAIRRAKLIGASAVLIFEDDVVLHPNFKSLVEALSLPEDWGLFYLGCCHEEDDIEPVSPGIVKTTSAIDTHAFAVNQRYYDRILKTLDAKCKPIDEITSASDRYLQSVQHVIPTYASFPNLAWQGYSVSDLANKEYSNYRDAGTQKAHPHRVRTLFNKMYQDGLDACNRPTPPSKVALLFLTREDVHHPQIWRDYISECPERVKVFSHPKYPLESNGGFLAGTEISKLIATNWGGISLVRASLNLLEEALEDPSITHFSLHSEACIPVQPLSYLLRQLDLNPKSRIYYESLENAASIKKHRASMIPEIPYHCWRFHPQWWLLDRITARWLLQNDYTELFSRMEVPDEAYFATLLSFLGYPLDDCVIRKHVTWACWEGGAGHPTTFDIVDQERLESIEQSGCFFARKFSPTADLGKLRMLPKCAQILTDPSGQSPRTINKVQI